MLVFGDIKITETISTSDIDEYVHCDPNNINVWKYFILNEFPFSFTVYKTCFNLVRLWFAPLIVIWVVTMMGLCDRIYWAIYDRLTRTCIWETEIITLMEAFTWYGTIYGTITITHYLIRPQWKLSISNASQNIVECWILQVQSQVM